MDRDDQSVEDCLTMLNLLITSKSKSISVYRIIQRTDRLDKSLMNSCDTEEEELSPSKLLVSHMDDMDKFRNAKEV
jgi:hypothetical protein